MNVLNKILKQAKNKDVKILLPEANLDKRVYNACKTILKKRLCKIVVLGEASQFDNSFKTPNCEIIDPTRFDTSKMVSMLYKLRKQKGMTMSAASELVLNTNYFASMLVYLGYADAMVAGANWSTADVLKPALQIIKTQKGKNIVVGSMLMIKNGATPLLFSDVSLNVQPTPEELAEIAISSAEFYEKIVGTPKVAMLSYSTFGSGKGELVDNVKKATQLAQKSKYLIDGEIQADSALDIATAKQKGVQSQVGGNANVLVFPDLNAGNISYKLVSRLAGYSAIGPIMINFKKPVTDLSRGCTTQEIVNTVLITKLLCN